MKDKLSRLLQQHLLGAAQSRLSDAWGAEAEVEITRGLLRALRATLRLEADRRGQEPEYLTHSGDMEEAAFVAFANGYHTVLPRDSGDTDAMFEWPEALPMDEAIPETVIVDLFFALGMNMGIQTAGWYAYNRRLDRQGDHDGIL